MYSPLTYLPLAVEKTPEPSWALKPYVHDVHTFMELKVEKTPEPSRALKHGHPPSTELVTLPG
jgi:hypothetical protein